MINTQTEIMSLFLPISKGMPTEGATIAGGETAESLIQKGDFLQFLLGSYRFDAKIKEFAPLSDAEVPDNEKLAAQVPAGSEEISNVEMVKVMVPSDLVFGAVNSNAFNNSVMIQNADRQACPDKCTDMLMKMPPVVNNETEADALADKYINVNDRQVGQIDNTVLSVKNAPLIEAKFTAGRIIDANGVLTGKEPAEQPESSPKTGGQITITGRPHVNDFAMADDDTVFSDQRLNRLADNLAVRSAEIKQVCPQGIARTIAADITQDAVWPEMVLSKDVFYKTGRMETNLPTGVSQEAAGVETSLPTGVTQKAARVEMTVTTDVSFRAAVSGASRPIDVSQKAAMPEASVPAELPSKTVGAEAHAHVDTSQQSARPQTLPESSDFSRVRNSAQDKSEAPRTTVTSTHSAENGSDDETVVSSTSSNISLVPSKKVAKESSGAVVSVKSTPQTPAESSRPIAQATGPTEKGVSVTTRAEVPAVRFVLPENVRESIIRPGNTITLRMEPEHLGSVRLTLTAHNNTLTGRIVVESPAAKLAVESNVHILQNRLSEEGLHLEQFQVSVGGEQARQFGHSDGSQFGQAPTAQTLSSGRTATSIAATSAAPSMTGGGYVNAGGVNWLA
jgi:flagellar hook-length control protein FliK